MPRPTPRHAIIGIALAVLLLFPQLVFPPHARGAPVVLLAEDFETGVLDPQWSVYDSNPASGFDYWGVSNYRPRTGTYSAWASEVGTQSQGGQPNNLVHQYDDDQQSDLVLALDLAGWVNVTLNLYYWVRSENGGGDLFQVWYAVAGVPTMLFENRGRAAWDLLSIGLPSAADQLILRFRSDPSNHNFEGAYVDDILITGVEGNPPTSSVSPLPPYVTVSPAAIPYTAQDGANESGVAYVELWYRLGSVGPFSRYTTGGNPLGQWTTSPIPFDPALASGEGYYEFYSIAVDNSSNVEPAPASPDAWTTIDTVSPSVAVTAPANASWSQSVDVTVSWTGADATSGLDRYETRLDGGGWGDVGLATSQLFTSLSEGPHTVAVMAFDMAGLSSMDSVSFGVDSTPPIVSVTSPSPGAVLNASTVTVTWAGSDGGSGLDRFETSLDAGAFVNEGLSLSRMYVGLLEGSHTVVVAAFDLAGNNATASVTFVVDTVGPAVAITSPPNASWSRAWDVAVSWTGSDATSGLDHYETRLDGGAWVDVGLATSNLFTSLAEGAHTVAVSAYDRAGLSAIDNVSFNVDTGAPMVSVTSPPDGAIFNVSTVNVTWQGSDAVSGLDRFETSLDGAAFVDEGASVSRTYAGLADGTHAVVVAAFDVAGNNATAGVTFVVDTVGPAVAITSPADGAFLNSSSVTVTWQGTNASFYETSLDGAGFVNEGAALSKTFAGLSEGPHTVTVVAHGTMGQTEVANVTFVVDTTIPSVAITGPSGGTWMATADVTVTWTGSDATSGLDRFESRLNGGAVISEGLAVSRAYAGLPQGLHTVVVTAFDRAGNSATSTVTFGVDTTAPSVTVLGPGTGTWFTVSGATVSWQGSDALSGLDRYTWTLDGGVPSDFALGTSRAFTGLSEGAHSVTIGAYDLAGNAASASVSFGVDTVAPAVTISSPTSGATVLTDWALARWSATDSTSGVDHFVVWVDQRPSQVLSGTELNLTGLANGDHTVHVVAVDRAGNAAETTLTFSVRVTSTTFENPYIGGLLLLLALLAAILLLLFFFWWRRRRKDDEEDEPAEENPATASGSDAPTDGPPEESAASAPSSSLENEPPGDLS